MSSLELLSLSLLSTYFLLSSWFSLLSPTFWAAVCLFVTMSKSWSRIVHMLKVSLSGLHCSLIKQCFSTLNLELQ